EESCVIRERKLRSVAESLVRFRESLMSYTYYIYKIWEKVKSKYTMRICSLREHRLKHEWNQMVWSVNNLRCGTAGNRAAISEVLKARTRRAAGGIGFYVLGGQSGHRRYFRARKSRWGGALQGCGHAWKMVDLATPMLSRCPELLQGVSTGRGRKRLTPRVRNSSALLRRG